MLLDLHQYKYYPYEKELALREIEALFMPTNICNNLEDNNTITIDQPTDLNHIERLVYFSKASFGANIIPTLQSKLETTVKGGNRQSTRYSVHGLHEYKGKFNPQ